MSENCFNNNSDNPLTSRRADGGKKISEWIYFGYLVRSRVQPVSYSNNVSQDRDGCLSQGLHKPPTPLCLVLLGSMGGIQPQL